MRSLSVVLLSLAMASCSERSDQFAPPNAAENSSNPADTESTAIEAAAALSEVKRLQALAEADPSVDGSLRTELRKGATAHTNAVNACATAPSMDECAILEYGRRAHDIRILSPAARSADDNGITQGPVAYRCEGLDALISAVFINSDPGAVSLKWLDRSLVLRKVPSGSGAKYSGKLTDGNWSFWTQGEGSMLTPPGKPDMKCVEEQIG
jgi:membrane-bound inhibitor of C-type lysozyme